MLHSSRISPRKRPGLSMLLAIGAFSLASTAAATDFYVAQDGVDSPDNPGTDPSTPLRTVGYAFDRMQPGDTAFILGDYRPDAVTHIEKSGQEGAPLKLKGLARNAGGIADTPLVRCDGLEHCLKIRGSHIEISGLTLQGAQLDTLNVWKQSHLRIENNRFSGAQRYALHIDGNHSANPGNGRNFIIKGNTLTSINTALYIREANGVDIAHNRVADVPKGDGIVVAKVSEAKISNNTVNNLTKVQRVENPTTGEVSYNLAAGIKVRSSQDVEVQGNRISDTSGAGIQVRRMDDDSDVGDSNRSRGLRIIDNLVTGTVRFNENNPDPDCKASGWPSAVVISRADEIQVIGNQVHGNWGEGITLNSSTAGYIEQNSVIDNYGVNVYLNNTSDTAVVRNFLSFSEGTEGTRYYRCGAPASGVAMANEITSHDPGNFRPLKNLTIASNIIKGGRAGVGYFWTEPQPERQQYYPGGLQNLSLHGNTLYGSRRNALIDIKYSPYGGDGTPGNEGGGPGHARNHINANIFMQPPTSTFRLRTIDDRAMPAFSFASNLWHGKSSQEPTPTPIGDYEGDPLLVNPDAGTAEGFKLSAGSPARDVANYTTQIWFDRDYFGTRRTAQSLRPDVGAHEHR